MLLEGGVRVFALLFQAGCAGDEVMGRGAWGRRALAARGDVLFWQPRLCLTFITLYLKESAHMRMQAFPTHVVCNHKVKEIQNPMCCALRLSALGGRLRPPGRGCDGAGPALTLLVIDNFRPQTVGPRRPG